MLDFIIVGQGIAGTMLSWHLIKAGQKLVVIDNYSPSSASNIASGITNPITGRRFVKTWLADELLPYAEQTYQELEQFFEKEFLKPIKIFRVFDSVKSQNDWSTRCGTAEYKRYLSNTQITYLDSEKVKNQFGCFEINGGTKLLVENLLSVYRDYLKHHNFLSDEEFDFNSLRISSSSVSYKGITAKKIIFCEGAGAIKNPYFKFLPFQLSKGECLNICIENFYDDRLISGEILLMPTDSSNEYYIGATHDWNFENSFPSDTGRNELLGNLSAVLQRSFDIVNQRAAVRPTVKDRRPFVGFHPEHPSIGIFNGMGTKGISLAPYFANHFVQNLLEERELMPEVDIKRFLS